MAKPARNRAIAEAYGNGEAVASIARRFGVGSGTVSSIAHTEGHAPRYEKRGIAQRAGVVTAFVSPTHVDRVALAAKLRNITPGRLTSRVMKAVLSDLTLLDNVLDDGITTDG